MRILVTGGAGFIGTHALILLLNKGYDVSVLDNLSNSVGVIPGELKPESILRVERLTGRKCRFELADIRDLEALRRIFKEHGDFALVVHFAGSKSVGQSVSSPLDYYENNVTGTLNLLKVMQEFGVRKIIFSSSSTVYGNPLYFPVDEKHPTGNCESPYGRTKSIVEQMMRDLCSSDESWKAIMLRYFNPIGAHPSGEIGEDPPGIPRNLIPSMAQIAVGRLDILNVFGSDYETPDGTAIRGYIHVMDLAAGHVAAIEKLMSSEFTGWKAYNLGRKGYSVLEVHSAFEKASGVKIPLRFVGRRPGDVPATFADHRLAKEELNWKAEKDLNSMCEDSWRFQEKYPNGYQSDSVRSISKGFEFDAKTRERS